MSILRIISKKRKKPQWFVYENNQRQKKNVKKTLNSSENKFYWFLLNAAIFDQRINSLLKRKKDLTIVEIRCADFIWMMITRIGQNKQKKNNEWTEEKNLMNKIPKRIQNKPQNHANWSQKRDSSQLIQPKRFIWQIMRAYQSDSKINIGSKYEKWSRLLFSLKYFDCVNFNMNFSSPIFWMGQRTRSKYG